MKKEISKIKRWYNKPYPIHKNNRQIIITSFLFALFIYLFLLVFQPFGISQSTSNKVLYLLGYFFITFFIMLLTNLGLPRIFTKTFASDHWTAGKSILFVIFHIVIIGIANWGYNYALTEDEEMQHDIFSFLFLTLAVGIFPIIFTTIYLEKYLSHKHQTIAHTLNNNIKISEKFPENQRITIITDNKNEILSMDLQDFLCVHSDGNYNEVFFLQERILQRKLIRATLGKIEKQLSVYPSIRRCHRSYLVNLDNVIEIQGNARNYSIILQDLEFPIPISRTFQKEILASIKLIKF